MPEPDPHAPGPARPDVPSPSLRRRLLVFSAHRASWLEHLFLALLAWPAQLLTQPGVFTADTKSYLYIDPGRYLAQSTSMWDPTVGLGTVTHQQIGYLFPMGPFFWVTHAVAVPTWVAQRLWVGLILFAAGAGVLFLCRTLGVGRPGRLVSALAYMLSPYVLQYLGHISVILLAFAALPWLVALVERCVRHGGWRYPAAVALVAAAMGSVNASSAFYVALGPLVWVVYAGVTRLHSWRTTGAAVGRIVVLAAVVCLWWVVGLAVEGGYGLDVLRYTETVQAVSTTSLSSEVLRGLGYWYFYGGDNFGPWISATPQFTEQVWVLGMGYALPLVAVAGAFVARWRHRVAFVAMVAVGMVLAVGAYPYAAPSPAGRVLRALFTDSTIGMALRSTDRATPLVLLGLAMLAGAAVTALGRRAQVAGMVLAGVAGAAAVVANPALWTGTTIPTSFVEAPVAQYQQQAADALDRSGSSAVLGVPGQPFAATFAGMSVDPVWPGLLTRPFVTREQQVMGSLPTEDLLYALDDPIQSGLATPAAIAPLARLMGVGDVLVQNDLAFTRYDQPDPAVLWSQLTARPVPGLGTPVGYGPRRPALTRGTVIDQQSYTLPSSTAPLPAVATVAVASPRALVRTESSATPVVVDGEGTGVADVAGTGLLAGNPLLLYAGTLDTDPAARTAALHGGATLVVTDTNRKQAFRWDNLQDVAGPTLSGGQAQPATPQNAPLDIFPGAPADAQTTTDLRGVAAVTASSSGNPFQYLPEDRPAAAIDGDPDTAWQVGPFLDPVGQWWQVRFDAPLTTDKVQLLQPQVGDHNQWITAATLTFDGGHPLHVFVGAESRDATGQVVTFPIRTFRTLRVTIDATNLPPATSLQGGISAVGLAEVEVGGVRGEEQVVMPSDLLRAAGTSSTDDRLALVMTRLRVAPATSRTDPEATLDRSFWLPTARSFAMSGTARVDALVPDSVVDAAVGRSGPVTSSTGRLAGDPAATASAAFDGDPRTAWTSPLGDHHQVGQSLSVKLASPVTFDHLDMQVVVDGRHSVPSRLRVSTEQRSVVVDLPKLPRQPVAGGSDTVTVSFPALRGSDISVTVLAVRPLRWVDYFTGSKTALPMAIAEIGIPGVQVAAPPSTFPSTCRDDLLAVDGTPVWVSLRGTTADALSSRGVGVALCGPDAAGLDLGPGAHHVVATSGLVTGIDLDQLVLDSAPGGGPMRGDTAESVVAAPTTPAADVTVLQRGSTSLRVRVRMPAPGGTGAGTGPPPWLVLGESVNKGWTATVEGGHTLGPPTLVDGFANGWLLSPAALAGRSARSGTGSVTIDLRWQPQQAVQVALLVSAAGGVLCLALLVVAWARRRRRRASPGESVAAGSDEPTLSLPVEGGASHPASRRVARLAATALAAGVVSAVMAAPLAGVVVAAAVAVAALVPRGRLLLAVGATGCVVATAVTMMVVEATGHLYGNGDWAAHFGWANSLTWMAVCLLVGELFLTGAGARPRAPRASAPPSPPS